MNFHPRKFLVPSLLGELVLEDYVEGQENLPVSAGFELTTLGLLVQEHNYSATVQPTHTHTHTHTQTSFSLTMQEEEKRKKSGQVESNPCCYPSHNVCACQVSSPEVEGF